jgi:general stress protein CsbA
MTTPSDADSPPEDRGIGQRRRWAVVLAVLSGVAAGAVLYGTAVAPWVHTDSVAYLLSAENLARGDGLGLWTAGGRFAPLPSPGYPSILAWLTMLGLDVVTAARWVNAAAFSALVGLVGYFAGRVTRNRWFGLLLAGVVLVHPSFARLYTGAMTEPVFITLSVGSLLVLSWSVAEPNRWGTVLAGAMASASVLTRHAGLALIPAGLLHIVLFMKSTRRDKTSHALAFLALAAGPPVAWELFARWTAADAPRALSFTQGNMWSVIAPYRIAWVDLVWSQVPWVGELLAPPYRLKLVVLVGLLGLGFFALARLWARKQPAPGDGELPSPAHLASVAGLYVLSYTAVIGLAYLFMDPKPDIDSRTLLAPMLVPLWIWWLSLPFLAQAVWDRIPRLAAGLTAVAFASASVAALPRTIDTLSRLHQQGDGYTGRAWASSGAIEVVLSLPPDRPLISSDAAAVLFLTRRPAFDLPELVGQGTRPLEARFGDDPTDPIERVFREKNGLLVLFDSVIWQLGEVYPGEADARLQGMTSGLEIVGDGWDGTVFEYPESP